MFAKSNSSGMVDPASSCQRSGEALLASNASRRRIGLFERPRDVARPGGSSMRTWHRPRGTISATKRPPERIRPMVCRPMVLSVGWNITHPASTGAPASVIRPATVSEAYRLGGSGSEPSQPEHSAATSAKAVNWPGDRGLAAKRSQSRTRAATFSIVRSADRAAPAAPKYPSNKRFP